MQEAKRGMRRDKVVARGLDRPPQWRQIVRMERWGRTRRGRRIGLIYFAVMAGVILWSTVPTLHFVHWPQGALYATLVPLALVAMGARQTWVGMDRPTLNDQAVDRFGEELDRLTPAERETVLRAYSREGALSKDRADERAKERRMQAESAAFRLLRWVLSCVVASYWVFCFVVAGAQGDGHTYLVNGAVAASWGALGVLALPVLIRPWTEPDEVGEPKIVGLERGA